MPKKLPSPRPSAARRSRPPASATLSQEHPKLREKPKNVTVFKRLEDLHERDGRSQISGITPEAPLQYFRQENART